jgi:hypothetical protein
VVKVSGVQQMEYRKLDLELSAGKNMPRPCSCVVSFPLTAHP